MTLGIGPVGGLWVIGLSPFRMVTVGPPFLQTILAGSASCTVSAQITARGGVALSGG